MRAVERAKYRVQGSPNGVPRRMGPKGPFIGNQAHLAEWDDCCPGVPQNGVFGGSKRGPGDQYGADPKGLICSDPRGDRIGGSEIQTETKWGRNEEYTEFGPFRHEYSGIFRFGKDEIHGLGESGVIPDPEIPRLGVEA